jgi:RecB family endonuclease NucS
MTTCSEGTCARRTHSDGPGIGLTARALRAPIGVIALFGLTKDSVKPVEQTSFAADGIFERCDLQRMLRDHIEVVAPNTLVISEEFGDWEDSSRRIDLLGLDRETRLVAIELKRTDDGGYMELQALRYAAMVLSNDPDQAHRRARVT